MRKQNGIVYLVVIFSAILTFSQDIPTLVLDKPVTIMLMGEQPTDLVFVGKADQIVHISTQTSGENAPDTVLTLMDADQKIIAYQDDQWLEGELVRDAELMGVVLPTDGTYIIRVDSFNGVSVGEVTVLVREFNDRDILSADDTTTVLRVNLAKGALFRHTFSASTDDSVTIAVQDISQTLDTVVRVLDDEGNVVALADDAQGANGLNTLDTFLTVPIAQAGEYVLEVRDFLGRKGIFELTIDRETAP